MCGAIMTARIVKRQCDTCRFWSEMIARAENAGGIEAVCLCPESPAYSCFKFGRERCAHWKEGAIGAIDTPPHGLAIAYAQRDAEREGPELHWLCLSKVCRAPLACGSFGYCRERNFDGNGMAPEQVARRLRESLAAWREQRRKTCQT
jgi:hypothetical protein